MPLSRLATTIVAASIACSALGGCCHPKLSWRYGEPGMPIGPMGNEAEAACGCSAGVGGHHALLARGGLAHGAAASAQKADYVSPTPKFHPLPAHPVFEPQPLYPAPYPLPGPDPRHDFFHPGY